MSHAVSRVVALLLVFFASAATLARAASASAAPFRGAPAAHAAATRTRSTRAPTTTARVVASATPAGLSLSPPATLSFVATSPVLTLHANGTATTTVQLMNPGPPVPVRFELVSLPGGAAVPAARTVVHSAAGLNTVSLEFKQSFRSSMTGATVVAAPASGSQVGGSASLGPAAGAQAAAPATQSQAIVVSLRRLTGILADIVIPAAGGLLLALIFYIGFLGAVGPTDPDEHVHAGASWNFKDSWATNVSVVGAAAATLITAIGPGSLLLVGIQLSDFALLTALWGVAVTFAPLILVFAARRSARATGAAVTVNMFLLAAAVTLFGVGAELATVVVLVHFAALPLLARWIIGGAITALALPVLAYAVATAAALVQTSQAITPTPRALTKADVPMFRSLLRSGKDTSLAL